MKLKLPKNSKIEEYKHTYTHTGFMFASFEMKKNQKMEHFTKKTTKNYDFEEKLEL